MPRPDRIKQVDVVLRVMFSEDDFEKCPEEASVDSLIDGLDVAEGLIEAVSAKYVASGAPEASVHVEQVGQESVSKYKISDPLP